MPNNHRGFYILFYVIIKIRFFDSPYCMHCKMDIPIRLAQNHFYWNIRTFTVNQVSD